MQLCDTTLYDWLRHRDRIIIEQTSDEKKTNFYLLNDLGQQQCWHIFKQLLTAVEVFIQIIYLFLNVRLFFVVSSFTIICSS